ncbi:MAG: RloB family protein [Bacteroidota bacterium]
MNFNKRILILCEGMTEYLYAKSLQNQLPREKRRLLNIEIGQSQQNDPLSIVKEAERKVKTAEKERNKYDAVWLFFDHDNWPQLKEALERAERVGFNLAFTAISIEYWFILHFEDCGRAFANGDECLKYLKKYWPNYHKTKINHFVELMDKIDIAIERAERLEKRNALIEIIDAQPYTSVHLLVSFFKTL